MNPAVQAVLGSLIRWALTIIATWLVTKGVLTPDEASSYVPELVGVILAAIVAGWATWASVLKQRLVNTALAMPHGATLNEAKAVVEAGMAPPATVSADHAPFLKDAPNPRRDKVGL